MPRFLVLVLVWWLASASGFAQQPPEPEKAAGAASSGARDADRRAAQWALSAGGSVRAVADGKLSDAITDAKQLPAGAFTLQEIDLQEGNVSDGDLKNLAGLSGLRKLVLAQTKVTDAGLVRLTGIASLEILNLAQLAISDVGVKELAGMPKLRVLNLGGTDVTDAGLEQLEQRQSLRSLTLAGTVVTDLGMLHVAGIKRLRQLVLEDTFVSDVGLAQLRALSELRILNLKDTITTRRAHAEFSKAVPGCKVQTIPGNYQAVGNGSLVGRRVLDPNEPRALKLKTGLAVQESLASTDDFSGEAGRVQLETLDPDTLAARSDDRSVTGDISPWQHDPKKDALAAGYLKIPAAGEYAFASTSADQRDALWIGTAQIFGPGNRQGSSPVRLQLDKGYVPIVSVGYAGATSRVPASSVAAAKITVQWQPPGKPALTAIDGALLFHTNQPSAREARRAVKPLKARPLPPAIAAPSSIAVSGARGFRPVAIESFCQKPLPEFLAGATLFAPRYKPTDSNTNFGRVEVEVLQDTGLMMAALWQAPGDAQEWAVDRKRQRQLEYQGWAYLGQVYFQDPLFETHHLYWRACKQGEKLVLRTRRFQPPLVIAARDPGIHPLDHLPTPDMPNRIAEDVLRSKTSTRFRARRFDELEALAEQLRTTKPRLKNGHSIQHQFYRGLEADANTDAQWTEELELYKSWLAAKPNSVAAHIAMGQYWRDYAWKARGGGYANTVTDDGWKHYEERIKKAQEWSKKAHELDEKDVFLCQFDMLLAVDMGYSVEQVAQIIDESLAIDPVSKGAIYEACRYFLPRWHGRPGDLEEFARVVADRTEKEWGNSVYSGIVWDARIFHGTWVFRDFKFDWQRVKQGYLDYFKLYPAATDEKEQFAQLACFQGDRPTAREAFARFDKPTAKFWGAEEADQLRRWAQDDYLDGEQAAVFECTRTPQLWLDWFADGKKWAVFDNDQNLVIWDAEAGKPLDRTDVNAQVWTAAIDPSGTAVVAADFSGRVHKFALDGGGSAGIGKQDRILGATLAPDGTQFVTSGRDMTIQFWDVEQAKLADTWETKPATMEALALSPDGKTLVTGSFDRRVAFWDLATKQKQAELPPFSAGIKFVRITSDGKLLAVLDNDQLSLWQLPKREKLAVLDGPKQRVNDLVFSPDGRYLAAATGGTMLGARGTVIIWDVAGRKLLHRYRGHKGIVRSVRFSPDGKQLASASDDMTIRLWKVIP